MDFMVGGTYQYLPKNMRCVVLDLSRVSGRMMVKCDDGLVVHDVGTHELGEALPVVPAPPTVAPAPIEAAPEMPSPTLQAEADPAEGEAPTPRRRFGRSGE